MKSACQGGSNKEDIRISKPQIIVPHPVLPASNICLWKNLKGRLIILIELF